MKIGLIVPGFSADASDWCIPVLVDVVRELSRRAEVHVFALRYPYRNDRYQVHGAHVHPLGGRETRGLARLRLFAAAYARIVAEHRRAPFSVLHGVWADEPGFIAVTMARLLRVPSLVSVMGGELVALPDIAYGGGLVPSNRLLSRLALHGAGRVTAGSGSLAARVVASMPPARASRVSRVVWGIDPTLFPASGPVHQLAGDQRVLHVGSLVPVKDHATLVRAFARLTDVLPRAHLHLLGEGPLRPELARQACELGLSAAMTFHGHVPRHELGPYYRAADLVVISSRHEAQSAVVLEAGLCGTPVVGTAVGLVSDCAPAVTCAVPVGDDRRLAEAVQAALRPEFGQARASAACRLVRSEYLAAQTAENLMSLYCSTPTTRRTG